MAYTEPTTKVTGNPILASDWNTEVRDNWKALADPWASYTPSLGNWTLGNGTLTGNYIRIGRLVIFRLRYDAGSTSTWAGNPIFGLPVSSVSTFSLPVGQALLADASGSTPAHRATRTALVNSGTDMILRAEDGSVLSASVPWTWASGDVIEVSGTYQGVG